MEGSEVAEGTGVQELFAQLFDANPLPSLVLDATTLRILDVNAAAVKALGYSRNEIRRLRTADLTVPEGSAQERELRDVRQSQAPTVRFGPIAYRRKDGSLMRALGTSYVVDYGGQSVRVAMLEDVTEREKLERQMRQAQRLESLGQLAGGVAHDFNNLLAVVLNVAELLKKRLETRDEEAARDVERIQNAGQAATRLTRQLLAFARQDVAPRVVLDLGSQIDSFTDLLRRTLGSHIQLSTTTAPDLWRVCMDPGQLEQIIINLAVNARDAMPHGGVLSISAENFTVDEAFARTCPGLEPGRHVQIQVGDSGSGMDKNVLEHVFEPFFTTKPVGQGTGMGLATVYGIVKQLGGHISIYSEVGRGTSVSVMLPATVDSAAVVEKPAPPTARVSTTGTVLVVEDFEELRNLFIEILSAGGYHVLPARDGADALDVARQHSGDIDLLLSDVVMPNMLGPELAARLRAERPEIRLLFMSGHARPMLSQTDALAEDVPLIQKPFMADELLDKITEVMSA